MSDYDITDEYYSTKNLKDCEFRIMDNNLFQSLPEDIKENIEVREFWDKNEKNKHFIDEGYIKIIIIIIIIN